MKRLIVTGVLAAAVAAVPAYAAKPPHPTHPSHPSQSSNAGTSNGKGSAKYCIPRNEGLNASGTLSAASLTAGTTAGHYDGTLTVDVVRANHKVATGSQTITLTNARVHFGKGVTATTAASGDRVKLHGKVTVLPKGCSATGFTATLTIHNATIKAPKAH